MNAKELMWAYLLSNGYANTSWNQYGGRFEINKKDTKKCFDDIFKNGIDWSKTNEPHDDNKADFNGTFAETESYTKTLSGTLYTKSGNKWIWKCIFDDAKNIFEIVAALHNIKSVESVIAERIMKGL